MIDRHGNTILVGWSAHEILWVEAAMTLLPASKIAAFQDIADMTGRSYTAIVRKASDLVSAKREAAIEARLATRRVMVPTASQHTPGRIPLVPSKLRQPSKSQLMGGKG